MKPGEANLEKLVRKTLRSEEISPDELIFHWDNLGSVGDRALLRVLRRQKGWEVFVDWASGLPEIQRRLQRVVSLAGVPDPALSALQRIGIQSPAGETPRSRANWILKLVQGGNPLPWNEAREVMLQDADLFAAIVEMLEENPGESAFAFLASLLELPLNQDQDRSVRKSLYQFKLKGFVIRDRTRVLKTDKEIFLFGENRLALWHPIFYFRNTSAFSPVGDLYLLMIQEGRDFETSEQKSNIRLDLDRLKKLAEDYSGRLRDQIGLDVRFHQTSFADALNLLLRSAMLLQGTRAEKRINDFLKFIGADSTPPIRHRDSKEMNLLQASSLLAMPYFAHWLLPSSDLEDFFVALEESEKGPIILPESKQREQHHTAAVDAFTKYFNSRNRNIWSVAFEKASYFLKNSDSQSAEFALQISQALQNEEVAIESIPAAQILFDRSIEVIAKDKQARKDAEKQTSLIISPQEYERQQKRK